MNQRFPPPKKNGVYTGTKEADKKTSGKIIFNFHKIVNYIAGWNYHLGGKYYHAICAVQLHLAHRESQLSTKQGGEKLVLPFLWNSKPEALKRKSLLKTFADGDLNAVDIKTKIESLFV